MARATAALAALAAAAEGFHAVAALGDAARVDASCGSIRVDPNTLALTDGCGRTRIFRGVNVIQKGWPWLPRTDAFDPFSSFCEADAAWMRSWGVNSIRLGAMWPGFEPQPGVLNHTYLTVLADVTAMAGRYGIYSLEDMHQDTLSGATCGEGIPDGYALQWAAAKNALPFPEPLGKPFPYNGTEPTPAACGTIDWSTLYFADSVGKAFQYLYTEPAGQMAAGRFWGNVTAALTSRNDSDPYVLGYEIINEPWSGDVLGNPLLMVPGVADSVNLQPFYFNVTPHIRAAEVLSKHIAMFESVTWDDFIPVGFSALPDAEDGLAALSLHFYSEPNIEGAQWQIEQRVADAKRLKSAAFLTEFDIGMGASNIEYVTQYADAAAIGYQGWEYKIYDGITGANYGAFNSDGTVATGTVRAFSRTFPEAVAGTIGSYKFDNTTGAFTLAYTQLSSATAPTAIFVGLEQWYPNGVNVTLTTQPPGAATWTLETHTPPAVPLDPAAPTPFKWGHVLVQAAAGAPDQATVQVVITAR